MTHRSLPSLMLIASLGVLPLPSPGLAAPPSLRAEPTPAASPSIAPKVLDAAERGDAQAQYEVGRAWRALGTPEAVRLAQNWFRRAAEGGSTKAQLQLGGVLIAAEKEPEKITEGIRWLERAAAGGEGTAAQWLASLYDYGKARPRDPNLVLAWLTKAYAAHESDTIERINTLLTQEPEIEVPGDLEPLLMRRTERRERTEAWWSQRAREDMEERFRRDSAPALYALGMLHARGLGLPQDAKRAEALLAQAAERGYHRAYAAIADLYAEGRGVHRDDRTAVRFYRRGVMANDPHAKVGLARMLRDGRGVHADPKTALALLNDGNDESRLELGKMFLRGLGTDQSAHTAWTSFRAASRFSEARVQLDDFILISRYQVVHVPGAFADLKDRARRGEAEAQYLLANQLVLRAETEIEALDPPAVMAWLEKAANQGHAGACLALARRYQEGFTTRRSADAIVTFKDPDAANHWYRRAAERGSTEGQVEWAKRVADRDPVEAVRRLWPAVQHDNVDAMVLLARHYAHGRGVPRNFPLAQDYYALAGIRGANESYLELGRHYESGKLVPRNLPEALRWFERAGRRRGEQDEINESVEAQKLVAAWYERGIGTKKDLKKALAWYLRATHQADDALSLRLARLYWLGPQEVRNESEGLYWFFDGWKDREDIDDGTFRDPENPERVRAPFREGELSAVARGYGNWANLCLEVGKRFAAGRLSESDIRGPLPALWRARHLAARYPNEGLKAEFLAGKLLARAAREDVKTALETFEEGTGTLLFKRTEHLEFLRELGAHEGFDHEWSSCLGILMKAAQGGDAAAEFDLAWLYANGRGVPRQWQEALKLLGRAASHGSDAARYLLPVLSAKNPATRNDAIRQFQLTADRLIKSTRPFDVVRSERKTPAYAGWMQALASMKRRSGLSGSEQVPIVGGSRYVFGVLPPRERTAELERRVQRAKLGAAERRNLLVGIDARTKADSSRDPEERIKWLAVAADHGSTAAFAELGEMYERGWVVPQDLRLAYRWWSLAWAAGETANLHKLKELEERLQYDQIVAEQGAAARWWLKHAPNTGIRF